MRGPLSILELICAKLAGSLQPDAALGRFLIALSVLLLAAMPFTEHFWTFDRFLRGGQDFELTLLCLLAFFCLVLLLARYARYSLSTLIALRRWTGFALHRKDHWAISSASRSAVCYLGLIRQTPSLGMPHLPLRI